MGYLQFKFMSYNNCWNNDNSLLHRGSRDLLGHVSKWLQTAVPRKRVYSLTYGEPCVHFHTKISQLVFGRLSSISQALPSSPQVCPQLSAEPPWRSPRDSKEAVQPEKGLRDGLQGGSSPGTALSPPHGKGLSLTSGSHADTYSFYVSTA